MLGNRVSILTFQRASLTKHTILHHDYGVSYDHLFQIPSKLKKEKI